MDTCGIKELKQKMYQVFRDLRQQLDRGVDFLAKEVVPSVHKDMFGFIYDRISWSSVLALLLVGAIIFTSNAVVAESLLQEVLERIEDKTGFVFADPASRFVFTRKTPNYVAYAGEKATDGGHRVRFEKDGLALEKVFVQAEFARQAKSDTGTVEGLESAGAGGLANESLSKEQQRALDEINKQIEDVGREINKVKEDAEEVQQQVTGLREETRRVVSKAKLVESKVERSVKFEEIVSRVDIEYRLTPNGMKEEIIIKDRGEGSRLAYEIPREFVYYLKAKDLRPEQADSGVWLFYDQQGEAVFRIPVSWAEDTAGAILNDIQTKVEPIDKSSADRTRRKFDYQVTLSVDGRWLSDPGRRFPITIDPNLEVVERQDDEGEVLAQRDEAEEPKINLSRVDPPVEKAEDSFETESRGSSGGEPALKVKVNNPQGAPEDFYLSEERLRKSVSSNNLARVNETVCASEDSCEGTENLAELEVMGSQVRGVFDGEREHLPYYLTRMGDKYVIFLRSKVGVQAYVLSTRTSQIALLELEDGAENFRLRAISQPVYQYLEERSEEQVDEVVKEWQDYADVTPVGIEIKENGRVAKITMRYQVRSADGATAVAETELKVGIADPAMADEGLEVTHQASSFKNAETAAQSSPVSVQKVSQGVTVEREVERVDDGSRNAGVTPHQGGSGAASWFSGVVDIPLGSFLEALDSLFSKLGDLLSVLASPVRAAELNNDDLEWGLFDDVVREVGSAGQRSNSLEEAGGKLSGGESHLPRVDPKLAYINKMTFRLSDNGRTNRMVWRSQLDQPLNLSGKEIQKAEEARRLEDQGVVIDWNDFVLSGGGDHSSTSLELRSENEVGVVFYPNGREGSLEIDPTISATVASDSITVSVTGKFEIELDRIKGGIIDSWYDLENDPSKTTQLADTTNGLFAFYGNDGSARRISSSTSTTQEVIELSDSRLRVVYEGDLGASGYDYDLYYTIYSDGSALIDLRIENDTGSSITWTSQRAELNIASSTNRGADGDNVASDGDSMGAGTDNWIAWIGDGEGVKEVAALYYYSGFGYNEYYVSGATTAFERDTNEAFSDGHEIQRVFRLQVSPDLDEVGSGETELDNRSADFHNSSKLAHSVGNAWEYGPDVTALSTSDSSEALADSFQRKNWYDGSRYWTAFHDDTANRIEFWYSTSGETWTENTSARISVDTNDFSIEANEDNAFIVYTSSSSILARSASSYPGPGFSWGSATTVYSSGATVFYRYPVISRDSNNNVWVGARQSSSAVLQQTATGGANNSSVSATLGSTATSGNLLVAICAIGASTTITGPSGFSTAINESGTVSQGIFYKVSDGTETSVSCTAGTSDGFGIHVYEYSNIDTSTPLDVTGSSSGNSSSPATGNATTTEDANLLVAGLAMDHQSEAFSSWTNSFTEQVDFNTSGSPNTKNITLGGADRLVRTTGTYSTSATATSGNPWRGQLAAFVTGDAQKFRVVQSTSANDITAWDSSTVLDESYNDNKFGVLAPLASGDMYAVFLDGTSIKGCRYDADHSGGARWENSSDSDCTDGANQDSIDTGSSGLTTGISALTGEDGNLHLAYVDSSGHIDYRKYDGSWQTAVELDGGSGNEYPVISEQPTPGDLYVFWVNDNSIFYKIGDTNYASGDWDAGSTTFRSTGVNDYLVGSVSEKGGVFINWLSGDSSPYSVNFSIVSMNNFDGAEGAYRLSANGRSARWQVDGSSDTRHNPAFKIRKWRKVDEPETVMFNGGLLDSATDYNVSHKPFSDAYFADELILHTTFEDSASVTSPDIGSAGTVTGATFSAGKYGNGAEYDATGEYTSFPLSGNVSSTTGTVEFWYQNTDGSPADWATFFASDEGSDEFHFGRGDSDTSLWFDINAGTDMSWSGCPDIFDGEWHHLRVTYDTDNDSYYLYVDGVSQGEKTDARSAITISTYNLIVGNRPASSYGYPVNGIIDEFRIYDSVVGPGDVAQGGDTGDSDEYLNDDSNNYTLGFGALDSSKRGEYFYLGSDDRFSGVNITLNTVGEYTAGSPAWITWQYWDGDEWSSLTDLRAGDSKLTQSFMENGNFYFTPPSDWANYSVNGSRDLYYIRGYNTGAAFSTSPVEEKITTDILLFQYFGDIVTSGADFELDPASHPNLGRHYLDDPYLEGFWAMESDGSTTEADLSDNGNDLSVSSGDTIPADGDEKEGDFSRDFENGDGDYLEISDASQEGLDLSSLFTIMLWQKVEAFNETWQATVTKYGTYGNYGYRNYVQTGGYYQFSFSENGSSNTTIGTASGVVSTGAWEHYALVSDGNYIRLYKNGSELTSSGFPHSWSGSLYNNDTDFEIGRGLNGFDGLIDEVAVFSRALSAEEIQEIYEGGIRSHSVEVDNAYKVVLDKDDSDDYLVVYDKAVDNDDPPRVFEFQGPMIEEGSNNEWSLRDDDDRMTNVISSTDTQVKIRVEGKYDDEDADDFLDDEGADTDLTVAETYTFDINGFYVDTETNFQDDGLDLDNGDEDDGYRWLSAEFDGESSGQEHLETIYYGDGTTESSANSDGALTNSQTYVVVQGDATYQDAIFGIGQTGWLDVQDGDTTNDRSWYYDVDISNNTDRLWTRQQNTRPGGSRNAQWFFRLYPQIELDTESEREAVVNNQRNPDTLSDGLSTGAEYEHYIQTKTFQPGPSEGMDTYLSRWNADYNAGGYDEAFFNPPDGSSEHMTLVKFSQIDDFSTASVDSATLSLWISDNVADWGSDSLEVRRILSANDGWVEGDNDPPNTADDSEDESTWNYRNHDENRWAGDASSDGGADAGCSVSGTDYASTLLGSETVDTSYAVGDEISISLTPAQVETWIDNNYGAAMGMATPSLIDRFDVWMSDYTSNDTLRPQLTLDYSTTFSPAEGGYGLDASSSTTYDKASMVQFDLDGGTYTRQNPSVKIRKWRTTSLPTSVTLENQVLYPGTANYDAHNYNASLKPFSEGWYEDGGSSTQIADGGDTGSSDEYLNDPSNTYTLSGLTTTDTIYLGSDDQFSGVNYVLSTAGVDGSAAIDWEYYNGSSWTDLSGDASETSGSETLTTTNGSFYFTLPSDWEKYSLTTTELGGSDTSERELYWVRGTPAVEYDTAPVIEQAWTDILLFQYLGDISSNDETFVITSEPVRLSEGSIQIDVPNRYRAIMNTGDTDDYINVYDRSENDSSPDKVFEVVGPHVNETDSHRLRWDDDRTTTILESSDVRVRIRVKGKLDTSAGGSYLDDDGGDDDIEVIEDYTFTTEGFFVDQAWDFKDGLGLDNYSAGLRTVFFQSGMTSGAHSDTIYYGDGETESDNGGADGTPEETQKYLVFQGSGSYQDGLLGIPRGGWYDEDEPSGQVWSIDVDQTDDMDLVAAHDYNYTTTGKHYASWFFLMLPQSDLDTESEREGYINDYRNPDLLSFTTGDEWSFEDDSDLEGLWYLEEADDATRQDSSTRGNDLTESTGDTIAQFSEARQGSYSADFENSSSEDEYLAITDGSQSGLEPAQDFTVGGWFYLESFTGPAASQMPLCSKGTTSALSYWLYINNTGPSTYRVDFDFTTDGSTGNAVTGSNVTMGSWYHLVATRQEDVVYLYVNGSREGSKTDASTSNVYNSAGDFRVGSLQTFGNFLDGLADELFVFSRALTAAEVGDIYRQGAVHHYSEAEGVYTVDADGSQVELDIDGETNVSDTLNGAVSAGDSSITLSDASGFPDGGGSTTHYAFINGDKFSYNDVSSNDLTGIPSSGELSVVGHADGSVVASMNRHKPFYKIRKYRQNSKPSSLEMEGSTLTEGTDYNIGYKPISNAYFADELIWYSTLEDETASESPDIGTGDSSGYNGGDFEVGKYGQGFESDGSNEYVYFPMSSNVNSTTGTVEFWYKETTNASGYEAFFGSDEGDNEFQLVRNNSDTRLTFGINASTYSDWNPVSINVFDGSWHHIRLTYDTGNNSTYLYIDGVSQGEDTTDHGAIDLTSYNLRVGYGGAGNPVDGIIDEFRVYDTVIGSENVARGGDTADASEYLFDETNDYTLNFEADDVNNRGEYLFLGADSPFSGVNVDLETNGIDSSADLSWQYWDGDSWASLESVSGFTDGTSNLTQDGAVYWGEEPINWRTYSVNGSTDLYYIRAHLESGSYTTSPVENFIKTDILILQHLGNITSADQTMGVDVLVSAVNIYVNESVSGAQSGASNPTGVGDHTPVISAEYNDVASSDVADKYQIVVYSDTSCSTEVWNTGDDGTSMTNCSEGNRCNDIDYGGSDLKFDGKTYYMQMRFWNSGGAAGAWSECAPGFTILGPDVQLRHGNYFFNSETERVFSW